MIGFSTFCTLRPKWCVTVGAKGTHNVCVCIEHQNVKLLTTAMQILIAQKLSYQDALSKVVSTLNNRDCMIHRCENCPGIKNLNDFIQGFLDTVQNDIEDTIEYQQWIQTDHCTLVSLTDSLSDFLVKFMSAVDNLTVHHYVAKAQSEFFRSTKEHLDNHTAVITLDFAENYSFLVQDAVQGFHWSNNQATIHPIVMYYSNNGITQHVTYCIISDCLTHDAVTVRCFLQKFIQCVKQTYPLVSKFIYFTDGAVSQYKNFKNMHLLYNHHNLFGIHTEWHFFATSHGKGACDGVAAVVKHQAGRASLQLVGHKKILSAQNLYEWATENLTAVHCEFVTLAEVDALRTKDLYENAIKIQGIRSNHCFKPILESQQLFMCRISNDLQHGLGSKIVYGHKPHLASSLHTAYQRGHYVAAVYDFKWFIGLVTDIYEEDSDIMISFMKQSVSNVKHFLWPQKTDELWVPVSHILCKISPPSTSTGRTYSICDDDFSTIADAFQQFKMGSQ